MFVLPCLFYTPAADSTRILKLEPTISETELRQAFAHCGPILRVQIRCSWGAATSIGRRIPGRKPTDRQYATVEFKHSVSISQALKLNGIKLHGVRIVVCTAQSLLCGLGG